MTTPEPGSVDADPHAVGGDRTDGDAEEEGHDTWRGPGGSGRPARTRSTWWLIGTVAVLVMTAIAVWFGVTAAHGNVQWINTGHQIASDTTVEVRFDLRRDASRAVTCQLEAQDFSHRVVGRTEVTIGPSSESPSRHLAQVQSAARAVTGYVEQCWYADEAPLPDR